MEAVTFGVLGSVTAVRGPHVLALKGPRHRAVLARLILARRRITTVRVLQGSRPVADRLLIRGRQPRRRHQDV